MTLGEKLSRLRKENNYTQEQLADVLGVSRQAISKWESDVAYPETEKLIRLSDLFHCSLDYLLKDTMDTNSQVQDYDTQKTSPSDYVPPLRKISFEKKSSKTVWGMPLWHIAKNAKGVFAIGLNAHGIVAVGLKAQGLVSCGVLSIGLLSFGTLSIGLLASGLFAIGLMAAGCFAFGLLTAGAISIGAIISMGAIAIGDFSIGALAIGKYFALGANARAAIAIGETQAVGSIFQTVGDLTPAGAAHVKELLDAIVPSYLGWAKEFVKLFLQ